MRSHIDLLSAIAVVLVASASAALASEPVVPGPIAAVGAPALLAIGGVFLAMRYLRNRGK